MQIHRLTDNNKVVSLPKKNQFLKFQNLRNVHGFQNVRTTVSDNLVHHPQRLAPPVSFSPPPPWIAPPRKKPGYGPGLDMLNSGKLLPML